MGFATMGVPTGREDLLLRTLYNETVEGFHRDEPDSRAAEEIGQRAGVSTVGMPETQTVVALAFRNLEKLRYATRVKDPDGPLRYRITRLGERHALSTIANERFEQLAADRLRLSEEFVAQGRAVERLRNALDETMLLLDKARAELDVPWWKRLFGLHRPEELADD